MAVTKSVNDIMIIINVSAIAEKVLSKHSKYLKHSLEYNMKI